MFLRRKTKSIQDKATYELRLEKYFDTDEAVDAYRLVKYVFIKGKIQDGIIWLGSGDKEWARRIEKHYGIKPTDPIFEED